MTFFRPDGICPADLYQFSDQVGEVDSYNIKQPSPATLERESLLNSRHRDNRADSSTKIGPSVNLRTASHKSKKRLTKNMAYLLRPTGCNPYPGDQVSDLKVNRVYFLILSQSKDY